VFTPDDRERIRTALLARAQQDVRISGGAITGSASVGREDRWSDVDLAFGVVGELAPVVEDFTRAMVAEHGAVAQLDVHAGPWLYRVFLLASTLQVDLAFVPAAQFAARAPTFKLVFGQAAAPDHRPAPAREELIGEAWLYALHVRSAIERDRPWQALHMLNGMRDHVLALACVRHGLPAAHARGVDALPAEVRAPFGETIARDLSLDELRRAFASLVRVFAPDAGPQVRAVLDEIAAGVATNPR
jgi:hypothetical protein